jgi:hypothetical protein
VPTPAAPQVRPGSASCLFEDVAGETANASLAEVSRGAFDAVDCRSTESLEGQLLAIQNSPEFTSRVAQEGWMVQTGTTADSVGLETIELSITDMSDSGSFEICAVVVSDSPRSKSLFCSDEGADPPQV